MRFFNNFSRAMFASLLFLTLPNLSHAAVTETQAMEGNNLETLRNEVEDLLKQLSRATINFWEFGLDKNEDLSSRLDFNLTRRQKLQKPIK